MHRSLSFYLVLLLLLPSLTKAQLTDRVAQDQCATMNRLQFNLERSVQLKEKFEQERARFNNAVNRGTYRQSGNNSNSRTAYTIPVVFHIVLTNPNSISDSAIQVQLNVLNKAFSGSNADTTRIPAYFKPFFGKSGIQFCLAQQTPTGEGTSGIERIKTTQSSFSSDDAVKHAASGGANSWNTKNYYNVWLCTLSGGILGYSTFPDDPGNASDQGTVIDYRSLPGGPLSNYNSGKTLPHETGHYFNLLHIWGDDQGACTGSDEIDDTPNQGDATKGCTTGIKTDACTTGGNGIMYQNYMDYSYDSCLVMFTRDQVVRMESALIAYRSTFLSSNGCTPPILKNYDARLSSIDQPSQRLCSSSFTPSVTIQNKGSQTLTSVNINTRIDNGTITSFAWTGSLGYLATASVPLPSSTTTNGVHNLTVYVSSPNSHADENTVDDTATTTIQFYNPVETVSEGFEGSTFPPVGWDVVNPDNYITWQRANGVSKTGSASVYINNFNYSSIGAKDDLRLPNITLQKVDSAFLSFQVAAANYTDPTLTNNIWDTLQVLASTDCGVTYSSVYKKYGRDLITRTGSTTTNFTPTASEWRKDSVDLTNYIGQTNVLLAFRNINGYQNNIYLDDIKLRTVIINPNLKRLGFLATPNPTNGVISVQFYPQPTNLRALEVYDIAGRKLVEINVAEGQTSTNYQLNITRYPAGTYILRAAFTNKVITRKILKF